MLPAINIPTPYNTIQTQKAIIENQDAQIKKLTKRLNSMKSGCTGLQDATLDQLMQQISSYSESDIIKAMRANSKVNKAVKREVDRMVSENANNYEYEFVGNNIRAILATLHVFFGFGKTRLERFLLHYEDMVCGLKEHYSFDYCYDIQPECDKILKRCGFDLGAFESKYGIRYGSDKIPD